MGWKQTNCPWRGPCTRHLLCSRSHCTTVYSHRLRCTTTNAGLPQQRRDKLHLQPAPLLHSALCAILPQQASGLRGTNSTEVEVNQADISSVIKTLDMIKIWKTAKVQSKTTKEMPLLQHSPIFFYSAYIV